MIDWGVDYQQTLQFQAPDIERKPDQGDQRIWMYKLEASLFFHQKRVIDQNQSSVSSFLKTHGKLKIKERQQRMASFKSGYRFPLASNGFIDNSEWAGMT